MLPNLKKCGIGMGYPMVSGQLRMEMVFQAHSWAHLWDFIDISALDCGASGGANFLQFPAISFQILKTIYASLIVGISESFINRGANLSRMTGWAASDSSIRPFAKAECMWITGTGRFLVVPSDAGGRRATWRSQGIFGPFGPKKNWGTLVTFGLAKLDPYCP